MAGDTENSEHRRAVREESVIVGSGEDETTLKEVLADLTSRVETLEEGA